MSTPSKIKYRGATYVKADAVQMRQLLEKSKVYLQELFEVWAREPTNYSGLKRLFSDTDPSSVQGRLADKFLTDLGGIAEDMVDFSEIARELAGK